MTTETEATSQSLLAAAIVLSRPGGCRWLTLEVKTDAGWKKRLIRDSLILDASELPGQVVAIRMVTGEVLTTRLSLNQFIELLEDRTLPKMP